MKVIYIHRHWAVAGVIFAIACVAVFVGGCTSRQHMDLNYGHSNAAALASQRVYPGSSSAQPNGLDSEEAAIVHDSYRRSIGKKGSSKGSSEPARVLLIEDDKKK
ncbi:MAG: hypothetical protein JXR76_07790 [Deltaproteobacteria bacterium]|nr:hypothetical protein [Deltaproteobacteria bacterium]